MTNSDLRRPETSEHPVYFTRYISLVEGNDVVAALAAEGSKTLATLRAVSAQDSLRRYAEGKWSIREVLGHIVDTERIMTYRALRIGRGDETPLPGFDQDPYIVAAKFDEREWSGLLEEFEAVRKASLLLFAGFPADAWGRRGKASNNPITARALAYVTAGHEIHHMNIVRERYLV